jgi:hypothetical protein
MEVLSAVTEPHVGSVREHWAMAPTSLSSDVQHCPVTYNILKKLVTRATSLSSNMRYK